MLSNFMIFNFFYLLHNLFTYRKINCEEHILKQITSLLCHILLLRYNELKHVGICNQQKVWKTRIYNTKVQLASLLQFLILKFDLNHLCKSKWIHEFIINFQTHVSSKESVWTQHNLKNKRIDIKTLGLHYKWLKLTNTNIIITIGHGQP
jgi:hypothetical protein